MATLAISREMLSSFNELEKKTRARVDELASIFQQTTAAELRVLKGVDLKRHQNQKDPRARTVRVDDNHRGIVCDTGDGERFILYQILNHADSDAWMARNRFTANVKTGALEVLDLEAIETTAEGVRPAHPGETPLYEHRSDIPAL